MPAHCGLNPAGLFDRNAFSYKAMLPSLKWDDKPAMPFHDR